MLTTVEPHNLKPKSWREICLCLLLSLVLTHSLELQARIPATFVRQGESWFQGEEGQRIVTHVLSWQTPKGSWPKNIDTATNLCQEDSSSLDGTFDNGATTGELRFLARANQALPNVTVQKAWLRALDLLLEAQYPSGGWPQTFPLERGYSRHITFNDHTMVGILELLQEVGSAEQYAWIDEPRRQQAREAFDLGVECITQSQIRIEGELTVWCAQHDAENLSPQSARSYELASLSGGESAGILLLLMRLEDPSPAVIASIRAGVAWYQRSRVKGLRLIRDRQRGRIAVSDPSAPDLWARFYDLESNQPFFCDRDGIPKDDFNAIGQERRNGYSWYGDYGRSVINAFEAWDQHH